MDYNITAHASVIFHMNVLLFLPKIKKNLEQLLDLSHKKSICNQYYFFLLYVWIQKKNILHSEKIIKEREGRLSYKSQLNENGHSLRRGPLNETALQHWMCHIFQMLLKSINARLHFIKKLARK